MMPQFQALDPSTYGPSALASEIARTAPFVSGHPAMMMPNAPYNPQLQYANGAYGPAQPTYTTQRPIMNSAASPYAPAAGYYPNMPPMETPKAGGAEMDFSKYMNSGNPEMAMMAMFMQMFIQMMTAMQPSTPPAPAAPYPSPTSGTAPKSPAAPAAPTAPAKPTPPTAPANAAYAPKTPTKPVAPYAPSAAMPGKSPAMKPGMSATAPTAPAKANSSPTGIPASPAAMKAPDTARPSAVSGPAGIPAPAAAGPTQAVDAGGKGKAQTTGFYVKNGKIFDANGQPFVPRGINNGHLWKDANGDAAMEATDALDNIAALGTNSIRIVWGVEFMGKKTDSAQLEKIVQKCIELGMVPMIELADFTGGKDPAQIEKATNFYVENKDLMKKYEKYIIINIANEWGDLDMAQNNSQLWADTYKKSIARLREAGINNLLVVDPPDYGKNYDTVVKHGAELMNADPQGNVMFGIHMYQGEGESPEKIRDAFQKLTSMGIPFTIGEFADEHEDFRDKSKRVDVKEDVIMEEAQKYGIGYYAWEWNNTNYSLANKYEGGEGDLTQYGQRLFNGQNGIKQTSQRASIFG
jgi:mannan endo-1,4-beta-mannosidase